MKRKKLGGYGLLMLLLVSCSADNFLTLAKTEAELAKKLSGTFSFEQKASDSFAPADIECIINESTLVDTLCGPFKQGELVIKLDSNVTPEDQPEIAILAPGETKKKFKPMNKQSAKLWLYTYTIETALADNAPKNGVASAHIRVGKDINGNPNLEGVIPFVINTGPLTDLPADGESIDPARDTVIFTFSADMDQDTFPLVTVDFDFTDLAESLGDLASEIPESQTILPSASWDDLTWTDARTLRLDNLPNSFGILPENVSFIIQMSGVVNATGTELAPSSHPFSTRSTDIVFQPPSFVSSADHHKNNTSSTYFEMYAVDQAMQISFASSAKEGTTIEVDGDVSIIKDNATKLLWTQCALGATNDSGVCDGDANLNLNLQDAAPACDALNLMGGGAGFGGIQGWRLPIARELQSIVDHTNIPLTVFVDDAAGFGSTLEPAAYWSITLVNEYIVSDPSAGSVNEALSFEIRSLSVDLGQGISGSKALTGVGPALCVNNSLLTDSDKTLWQKEYTEVNDSATGITLIKDEATGLHWERCTTGPFLERSDNGCPGTNTADGVSYSNAATYCSAAGVGVVAGKTPRLPTVYELDSLADYNDIEGSSNNYINDTIEGVGYWSQTSVLGGDFFMRYTFGKGYDQYVSDSDGNLGYVRCVFE